MIFEIFLSAIFFILTSIFPLLRVFCVTFLISVSNEKKLFYYLGIDSAHCSYHEKIISALGGFIGIYRIIYISTLFVGAEEMVYIVTSMGTSEVLLFVVPPIVLWYNFGM